MIHNSNSVIQQPAVYLAPGEAGGFSERPNRPNTFSSARRATDGETDILLRRSRAMVERLRQAVEARTTL